MNLEQLIQNNLGTIVDVRTPSEFHAGHIERSINIPVSELLQHLEELKKFEMPIILCCASGGRSTTATHYLKEQGIDCLNAGSWHSINHLQTQLLN
jgi:rhodanese-related sulfurtransferase